MALITDLPPEILHAIVQEIHPRDNQKSLAALACSSKPLYLQIIPYVYNSLRIKFAGPESWPKVADTLRCLVPPGSYTLPAHSQEEETVVDRKGKGVAGRLKKKYAEAKAVPASACNIAGMTSREFCLRHIREVVVEGYWMTPRDETSEDYHTEGDNTRREHLPSMDALEGLLLSLTQLRAFSWNITKKIPPKMMSAITRFDDLLQISMYGDTHMHTDNTQPQYAYNVPSVICNNPTPLSHNSLVTIKAHQIGDMAQVIQYGDVIRTAQTWQSLRSLELDLSSGFIGMIVELEPMEPDILCGLFRPPPPPRGQLESPKLKLHQIKLKEIPFQAKGVNSVVASVDPRELRDLDFCLCQDGILLLKRWQNNVMQKLERLFIKEELSLQHLWRFLQQFGNGGECRNLKSLELSCWHMERWPPGASDYGYDYGDADSMYSDDFDGDDDVVCDCPVHAELAKARAVQQLNALKHSNNALPQPWRSIKELQGREHERWGLIRLALDMRPAVASILTRRLPQHEIFLEGFWRLRELAIPVSYNEEHWNDFIETVAALPNLEYLFILNPRPEPISVHSSGPSYNFGSSFPYLPSTFGGLIYAPQSSGRQIRQSKKKSKGNEPDKQYVDALAVASRNRLHTHGDTPPTQNGVASSSSAAATGKTWNGRLRFIGIRSGSALGGLGPRSRVWRIVVTSEAEGQPNRVVEKAVERRMSLRSSKKRKVEMVNWRVAREGEKACRLEEVKEPGKNEIGNGIFRAVERN